ncbi:p21 protein (Cdc42 Rac)-activated kinase [Chamberlinius hualienensis]
MEYVFLKSGLLNKAETSFNEALKINPTDPATQCQLALVYIDQRKFDEAIRVSRQANKLHPNLSYTHVVLGQALEKNNQLSEAEECYENAIQLDPQNFNYLHSLSLIKQKLVIFNQQGNFQDALSYCKEAVRIKPSFLEAHMIMGSILRKLDDIKGSVKCYEIAVEINPDSAVAHNCLGLLLMEMGKHEEAFQHFKKSIDLKDKNRHTSYCNMDHLLSRMGKFEDAVIYYNKAIKIDPKYAVGHSGVAVTYEKLKDFENALKHHQIAIETLVKIGDYENAEESFATAINLNENLVNNYMMMAEMFMKLRRYQEAATHCKKAFLLLKYEDDKVTKMLKKSVSKEDPMKLYSKIKLIERGRFGEVHLTEEIATGNKFAVKIINFSENVGVELFMSEIFAMKAVTHENIVVYVDSYLVGQNQLWMAMEYLEGGSLSCIVSLCELTESQIGAICKEILQGLKYLHSLSIVHCDIKSGNILLGMNGQVKIADFGLCAQVGPEIFRNAAVETFYWKAPEIIRSEKYGNSVDIWSFGIVIIEMIDGYPPEDTVAKIITNYKVTANSERSLSVNCHDFLDKCLQFDASKRASAVELLEHQFLSCVDDLCTLVPLIEKAQKCRKKMLK